MNVKTCNKCHIEKLLTEFYKCKKFKDGLDYTCKVCSKQNSRQHYIKNKDKIDLHNKQWSLKHKEEKRLQDQQRYLNNKEEIKKQCKQRYLDYKQKLLKFKKNGCMVCGYNKCSRALEFHHLDPSKKEHTIANIRSKDTLTTELDKCVLLCSNCHQEVHDGLLDLSTHLSNLNN